MRQFKQNELFRYYTKQLHTTTLVRIVELCIVVNRINSICGKHKMMQIKFIQKIYLKRMRARFVLEIPIFFGFNGSSSKNGYWIQIVRDVFL